MMIQVEDLTKEFGPVLAVDHVSFTVDRGEIVGFLGRNGAGKTTTMRILTTYLPATSGIARVAGYDVMTQSREVRQNIGYLPESVPLYGEMRVEEYLHYRSKLKGMGRRNRLGRIGYCLERCRLKEVRHRLLGTLSKGYRQRVGLADAMLHSPPILILDEPTSGLDPIQIRETLNLIRELSENHTVLFSTHILSEVEAICDRVIIIRRGRVGLSQRLDEIETSGHVLLEGRGQAAVIEECLRGLEGVASVDTRHLGENLAQFEIRTAQDADLREAISAAVAARGFAIRTLTQRPGRLEDAFFQAERTRDERVPPDRADDSRFTAQRT